MVIGVEAEDAAGMTTSLRLGKRTTLDQAEKKKKTKQNDANTTVALKVTLFFSVSKHATPHTACVSPIYITGFVCLELDNRPLTYHHLVNHTLFTTPSYIPHPLQPHPLTTRWASLQTALR